MGDGKNVLFIDFGHSKLSASFVRFTESKMDIIFEKANRNLGCRDIDKKIVEYLACKFENGKGLKIGESKRAGLKLVEAVEKQRKVLSGIMETEVHVESLMEDEDLSEVLTRDMMQEIAKEVFEQIQAFLNMVKDEFKKLEVKYDSVELIGGGSRIPKIISIIQEVFEIAPSRTTNSSEAIARGATLAAVQQSGLFRFHSFNISNRIDYGIKLVWASP
jgi:molecular chaperone DnaK (HSP70)